jgi:hypothetical protein
VDSVFPAPVAELLELDLPLDLFLVLAGRVIDVLARRAAEPYQFFREFTLGHTFWYLTGFFPFWQYF